MLQCKATNCIYKSRNISPGDEVRSGKNYYHKKCKELLDMHRACVAIYSKEIDPSAPKVLLGKAFKDMIYEKRIDPNLLKFTLEYCVKNNKKPKSVFSLNYMVSYREIQSAYKKSKERKVNFKPEDAKIDKETKISYHPKNKEDWRKIFDE